MEERKQEQTLLVDNKSNLEAVWTVVHARLDNADDAAVHLHDGVKTMRTVVLKPKKRSSSKTTE